MEEIASKLTEITQLDPDGNSAAVTVLTRYGPYLAGSGRAASRIWGGAMVFAALHVSATPLGQYHERSKPGVG